MGAQLTNGALDGAIARLAANQHGVVSLEQLERIGIHRRGRARRVAAQRLDPVHRGVYAVGHGGLSQEGRWMAAVLACGPRAVLSHTSAAALWQFLPQRGFAHVTVAGEGRVRNGIKVHRSRTLTADQITRRNGIPVTTASRTLAELRRILPQPQFAAALRQAEFLRLPVDPASKPDGTRSELEARFLRLCRRHRIPQPEVNEAIGPYVVDFLWPEQRLIVEVDGYRAHGSHRRFESDRARDVELKLLGFEVLRFTWRQLASSPPAIASAVRRLLTARGQ